MYKLIAPLTMVIFLGLRGTNLSADSFMVNSLVNYGGSGFGGAGTYDENGSLAQVPGTATGISVSSDAEGYAYQTGTVTGLFGSTPTYTGYSSAYFASYTGTISSTGRTVVAETGNISYQSTPYGFASYTVASRPTTYTDGATDVIAAADGDEVTMTDYSIGSTSGSGQTVLTYYTNGYVDVGVADAPSISVSGITPYLTPVTAPVNPSKPLAFEFGLSGGSATRPMVSVPYIGEVISPFDDKLEVETSLLVNGNVVESPDYSLDFSPGDATLSQGLSDDLANLNLDLSGLSGSSADVELLYSLVATAYDADGVATTTDLSSGSLDETIDFSPSSASVPLPSTAWMSGLITAAYMTWRFIADRVRRAN